MKEEEKGISVIFEELLRKRQKNEQYIHKTFVKHHLYPIVIFTEKLESTLGNKHLKVHVTFLLCQMLQN
jgi:hypothetical protein